MAEKDLWHVTEGQKVQPLHVGVGLRLGDDDGHEIKEKTHHQVSSCPMDTKLGVPAALPMHRNLIKRAVHYLQFPLVQTPPPPHPRVVKNTHFGGRQHQGHRAGVDDIPMSGRQPPIAKQGM